MAGLMEKVKGGYMVDGLELLAANCGCGGLTGPGGTGIGDCCLPFSRRMGLSLNISSRRVVLPPYLDYFE
jgi:hypothetical protein